ncbi:MAG TPA: hypothetical protein DEF51_04075 [Myxococcales bacterium]|nr:hypothetical protein [Myxococcales bacterium]
MNRGERRGDEAPRTPRAVGYPASMLDRERASFACVLLGCAGVFGCGGAGGASGAALEPESVGAEETGAESRPARDALSCRDGEWRGWLVARGPVAGHGLAVDAEGGAHVVYTRSVRGELVYAERRDGAWTTTELAPDGANASIATSSGEVWVSSHEYESRSLVVARRVGDEWSRAVVDSPSGGLGRFGSDSSIATHEGAPSVAYYVRSGGGEEDELRYATRSGSTGEWTVETVDDAVEEAQGKPAPLLLMGPEGEAHVVHIGTRREDPPRLRPLLHARRGEAGWTSERIDDVSSTEVGFEPSATIDASGGLHVTFHRHGAFDRERGFVDVVYATRAADGAWRSDRWDWPDHVGRVPLAIDAAGRTHALSVGGAGETDQVMHSVGDGSGAWLRSTVAEEFVNQLRLSLAPSGEVHALYIQDGALMHAYRPPCDPPG